MAHILEVISHRANSLSNSQRAKLLIDQHRAFLGVDYASKKEIESENYLKYNIRMSTQKNSYRWLDEQYFNDFFNTATIRLGSIRKYISIDSEVSKDEMEGFFVLNDHFVDQERFTVAGLGENALILCMSRSKVNHHGDKKFAIAINDNVSFFRIIKENLIRNGLKIYSKNHGSVEYKFSRVIQNKYKIHAPNEISHPAIDLDIKKYFVKKKRFSFENEYRYVFITSEFRDEIFVTDKQLLQYCKPFIL